MPAATFYRVQTASRSVWRTPMWRSQAARRRSLSTLQGLVDMPRGARQWEAGALLGQVDTRFSPHRGRQRSACDGFQRTNHLSAGAFFCRRRALVGARDAWLCRGFAARSFHGMERPHLGRKSRWFGQRRHGQTFAADRTAFRTHRRLATGRAAGVSGARLFAQYVEAIDENDIATLRASGISAGLHLGVRYRTPDFIFGAAYTTPTNTKLNGGANRTISTQPPPVWSRGTSIPVCCCRDGYRPASLSACRTCGGRWIWTGSAGRTTTSSRSIKPTAAVISTNKAARHYTDTLSLRTGLKVGEIRAPDAARGLRLRPDAGTGTAMPRRQRASCAKAVSPLAAAINSNAERISTLLISLFMAIRASINATDQDLFGSTDTHLFEGTYRTQTHVLGLSFTAAGSSICDAGSRMETSD